MASRKQEILKMRDVMQTLNLSREGVYKLIAEGRLRCFRLRPRGERLFRADEVETFVDSLLEAYKEN